MKSISKINPAIMENTKHLIAINKIVGMPLCLYVLFSVTLNTLGNIPSKE